MGYSLYLLSQLFKGMDRARNTPFYTTAYENHGGVTWQLFSTDQWPRNKPYTFWVTGRVSHFTCCLRVHA